MQKIQLKEMLDTLDKYILQSKQAQPLAVIPNLVWTFNTIKEYLDKKRTSQIDLDRHLHINIADNLIYVIFNNIPSNNTIYINYINDALKYADNNNKTLILLYEDHRTSLNEDIAPSTIRAIELNKETAQDIETVCCNAYSFSNEKALY